MLYSICIFRNHAATEKDDRMDLVYLKYISRGLALKDRQTVLRFAGESIEYSCGCTDYPELRGTYADAGGEMRLRAEALLSTFRKRSYGQSGEAGESWELEYMYEGEAKPHRKRGGDVYPPLWPYLMELTETVAGPRSDPHRWHAYYSVRVDEMKREYFYLSDDRSLQPGDRVLVPCGFRIMTGKIIKIREYCEDELPVPLSAVRKIKNKISSDPNARLFG